MRISRLCAVSAVILAPVALVAPVLMAGPASAANRHDGHEDEVVAWVSCDDEPTGILTVQPKRHVLSCADHNSGLRNLDWSSWGEHSATGTGTYYWNDCTPNCSAGTNHKSKATVVLKRPRVQSGEPVFTRVIVTYTDENGETQVDRSTSLQWRG